MNKNIEKLVQELNEILNQVIRENKELKEIIRSIHAQGYNVQISFNSGTGGEAGAVARTDNADAALDDKSTLNLSKDDYLFLKSIKIAVDD
ncbi:MAG TPA: hypothetical protein PKN61_00175 [Acidobacteriota bacterium]|nr:hypothetical protein [Acidobacteriota bacterium]HNT99620.1 hypothetical protein [Acidobacteriota bacterium]HPB27110.1 hypothetical protein [Acidobacteriota bacterium]HQF86270.1 hypothetical protein [Acidobacteriota bacterium]HQG90487.1 hypothetical protein [Acidobacteriota bacterium]